MDLYFSPLACSLATRIALYEAGVSARFIEVDGRSKRTLPDGDSFRDVNALGLVPVLRTDAGELITENAAILQYVADQHPGAALAPAGGMARTRLQEWLCFIGTELHKGLFVPLLDKSAPAEVKAYTLSKYTSRLDYLEQRVAGREYVLDAFSVADAYLVAVLNWSIATSINLANWPAIAAYHERLRERPRISRAIKEELVLYQREQERNGQAPVAVPKSIAG